MNEKWFAKIVDQNELDLELNAVTDQGYFIKYVYPVGAWQDVYRFMIIAERLLP